MVIISAIGNEAEGNGGENPWYALQEEEEEKWHKYYSSSHRILLVGEGDFSFSLCLAKSFGSASNIVATSLDSYAALIQKYKGAKENVKSLKKLGATVIHEVDVTRMNLHPDVRMKKFDRIIYNFPHAGFKGKEDDLRLISKHRCLVYGFLHHARGMLRPDGEIHVSHKTTGPYTLWNLPQLASWNSLILLKAVDFKIEDFPGYINKRGDSSRCDEAFPLGKCSTFIFVLPYKIHKARNLYPAPGGLQTLRNIPFPRQTHSLINYPRDFLGIARPPLFHSPGLVWPPPHDSLGIARPSLFHSPGIVWPPPRDSLGIVQPPFFHSPGIFRPPPHSFAIVPFQRETYSITRSPQPPPPPPPPPPTPPLGLMGSSMHEDNTRIPRHINMLKTPEVDASYPVHEAARHGFERYPAEDPRRSSQWLSTF